MSILYFLALYFVAGLIISFLYTILNPEEPETEDIGLAFLFWWFMVIVAITSTLGKVFLKIRKMARKLK